MSITRMPDDGLIAFTLEQMNARMAARIQAETQTGETGTAHLRGGLLYTGNVHDAVPRRLLLDPRLSPLDKTAWIMIRLCAQQTQGAVFPTYDELQLQLASPFNGKASRETVSRVLLMLRLTGWLSLCRRVRDDRGRVRGNIYAQHDEPLSARDAESLDPTWLDTVARSCTHKNRTVSQTAWSVLADIQDDPTMRHQHSRLALVADRLGSAQTPQQMAARVALREAHAGRPADGGDDIPPGSSSPAPAAQVVPVSELSPQNPGSASELSTEQGATAPGSLSELMRKSVTYGQSAKPNCYVRSFTQSVNKTTYVPVLPDALAESMTAEDHRQITAQLCALPEETARQVLAGLDQAMARGSVANPTGWLLAVIKRARHGELYPTTTAKSPGGGRAAVAAPRPAPRPATPVTPEAPAPQPLATKAHVSEVVARLRQEMARARVRS